MQKRIRLENKEKIKQILRRYTEADMEYNEPHFTTKLERENIDKNEVIKNILNPEKLVMVGVTESKNKRYDHVYDLYFQLSKNRKFKVPISIKPKCLYLMTIFKIKGKMQNEAEKYYK